jgi:hypothetical protein
MPYDELIDKINECIARGECPAAVSFRDVNDSKPLCEISFCSSEHPPKHGFRMPSIKEMIEYVERVEKGNEEC